MTSEKRLVTAEHPLTGSTLYAAVDPDAHHVESRIADRKFAAFLTPFRDENSAAVALLEAGAMLCGPGRPADQAE